MWRAPMRSFVRGAGWYKALMSQPKVIGVAVAAGIAIRRRVVLLGALSN
jgi:hypothetical protein